MNGDFEKLDKWMMDAARRERENRVPEKELKEFHDGVMKKILERQNAAGAGFPAMGLAFAAAVSLAVIFGAVIYIQTVKVEKPVLEETMKSSQDAPAQVTIRKSYDSIDYKDDGKKFMSGFLSSASAPQVPAVPPLTEAVLVEEIEALKELGAWTEEDEAEAGIPVEVTFADLEAGTGVLPQAMPAAV